MGTQGLSVDQMVDLGIAVQDQYPADKSFEYLFPQQKFHFINQMMTDERIRDNIQGGEYISRFVNYRENGAAQFVLPAEVIQPSTIATLKKLTIPWVHAKTHYVVIREELLAYRGAERIVDFLKGKRLTAQVDQALLVENAMWGLTTPGSNKSPLSLFYWMVPITSTQVAAATTLDGSHQGANPAGFSDCGGIDASDSTFSRWRNWNFLWPNSAGEYTETAEDRMDNAFIHLEYEAPENADDLKMPVYKGQKIFVPNAVRQSMRRAMKDQNSQVGVDLWNVNGVSTPTFKGVPMVWTPQLDGISDATGAISGSNPVVLANLNYLFPVIREGDFFREDRPRVHAYQPDVTITYIDLSYNVLCNNRQLVGAVGSYVE